MITPEEFLNLIKEEEKDMFKLGYIESDAEEGRATIKFDGEDKASGKSYLTVNYEPVIGERVLLVNVKGTYLILGNIGQGLQLRSELSTVKEDIEGTDNVLNTILGVDEDEL